MIFLKLVFFQLIVFSQNVEVTGMWIMHSKSLNNILGRLDVSQYSIIHYLPLTHCLGYLLIQLRYYR
jgi:hypothetical protein